MKFSVFKKFLRSLKFSVIAFFKNRIAFNWKGKKEEIDYHLKVKINPKKKLYLRTLRDQNSEEILENSSRVCYAESAEIRDEYKI
jgi:hypothetical protein